MLRDGFYVEAVWTVLPQLEIVGRFDGLRRIGNVSADALLRVRSGVLRSTVGLDVVLDWGVRLEASAELYDFSDIADGVTITGAVAAAL